MDKSSAQEDVVYLAHFLLIILTIAEAAVQSDGRYLRPSNHGLTFQNTTTPTKEDAPQMLSFFSGGKPVSFESNMPLPEAKNLTGTTVAGGGNDVWWNRRARSRNDASRDHLKEILLVASLVCGLVGVIFLVVSGVVFLFRHRKQRSLSESASTLALTGGAVSGRNKS